MIRFVKYFFFLFRVIREPGQPNEQLRELAIYWDSKIALTLMNENKQYNPASLDTIFPLLVL